MYQVKSSYTTSQWTQQLLGYQGQECVIGLDKFPLEDIFDSFEDLCNKNHLDAFTYMVNLTNTILYFDICSYTHGLNTYDLLQVIITSLSWVHGLGQQRCCIMQSFRFFSVPTQLVLQMAISESISPAISPEKRKH